MYSLLLLTGKDTQIQYYIFYIILLEMLLMYPSANCQYNLLSVHSFLYWFNFIVT